MPAICPSCATENPEVARFCMACGAGLVPAVAPVEERRLVSVLFADLVGFTARSDRADPEDVRRTLVPFHRAAKDAIEAFGGMLDKFIGDAAMGVFGAPVAHGDDPERAVRAALALVARIDELRVEVDPHASIRVAVNTGEAVVAFGSGPQVGEAVAGDVVNTASRMQSLAPEGGVVVGEHTWEAVRGAFEAEPMEPVSVKGKSEPLRVWRIVRERTSVATLTPMIGRDDDLAALREALSAAIPGGTSHLVTLVADPGLGKSRLLQAFREECAAAGVAWHQVGFAPYGQQSPFRPLADLVRSSAGLGPSHPTLADLGPAIALAGTDERAWLRARLAPVFGEDDRTEGSVDAPEDTARAVAMLLAASVSGPAVFALEDVHWAEPSVRAVLLAIAEELASTSSLLVCTARPNALDDADRWNARVLAPLSVDQTAEIVLGSLRGDALAGAAVSAIAERAAGNPLFAVEFARGLGAGGADVGAVPTTVRGVIGARLDALAPAVREVALDAAVLGTTFWVGALEALADDPGTVPDAVRAMRSLGIATDVSEASLAGHVALVFGHALIQEEAYGRLPRSTRARKHLAAGMWLQDRTAAAPSPTMVARHFTQAVELARASGEDEIAERAREPAIAWSIRAATEIWRLDPSAAFDLYRQAEALGPTDVHQAEELLAGVGLTGRRSGRLDASDVLARYERGLELARARGDAAAIGAWLSRLGSQCGVMGDSVRAIACYDEAIALLEPLPPGRPLAAALAFRAEEEMLVGHASGSMALVERSLPIARERGLDDLVIMGLHLRGDARCSLGDLSGVSDLQEALDLARRSAGASEIVTSINYVADWRWQLEGARAAIDTFEEGLRLARERAAVSQGRWTAMHVALVTEELGEWDRALDLAGELLGVDPGQLDATLRAVAAAAHSTIWLRRGRPDLAWDPEAVLRAAEGSHELQALAPALGYAVEEAAARGDRSAAVAAIEDLTRRTDGAVPTYRAGEAPRVARAAAAFGVPAVVAELMEGLDDLTTVRDVLHRDASAAVLAEAAGDLDGAAAGFADLVERWATYGHAWEEAQAALGVQRTAAALGRGATALEAGERASSILTRLGVPDWGPLGYSRPDG